MSGPSEPWSPPLPEAPGFEHSVVETPGLRTHIAAIGETGRPRSSPPGGGTKIAWGGPPLDERHGRDRMHLDLVADDIEAKVERLVGLGATVVSRGDDVEMADPDGNEFRLRR